MTNINLKNQKCKITCKYNISKNCVKTQLVPRLAIQKNLKHICLYCSRKLNFSKVEDTSSKYKELNDSYFEIIDSEEKAYFLGWIASDGCLQKSSPTISIKEDDKSIFIQLLDALECKLPLINNNGLVGLKLSSQKLIEDCCKHLQISYGKKSEEVKFPNLISSSYKWAFIRGYFDGGGLIETSISNSYPNCKIISSSKDMLVEIGKHADAIGISYTLTNNTINWFGLNCIDFLGKIYDNANIRLSKKWDKYLDWCQWKPNLNKEYNSLDFFKCVKTNENAVLPFKEKVTDSGYDLTLISEAKKYGSVTLYDTGLKIKPIKGWYFDLVPRSSIIKTGYMLANNIGVIDQTYTGNIFVPLVKIDKDAPDLKLPIRIVQIIPRPIIHTEFIEVDNIEETGRATGGFGSTGN